MMRWLPLGRIAKRTACAGNHGRVTTTALLLQLVLETQFPISVVMSSVVHVDHANAVITVLRDVKLRAVRSDRDAVRAVEHGPGERDHRHQRYCFRKCAHVAD